MALRGVVCATALASLALVAASGAQTGGGTVEAVVDARCDRYGCAPRLDVGPADAAIAVTLREEDPDVLVSVAAPAVLRLRADPRAADACTAQDTTTIRCRGLSGIGATGGPGDDRLDASAMSRGVALSGGDGADELVGGAGDDLVAGGPGIDRMDGGGGRNTVDLSSERAGIVADLAAQRVSTADVIRAFEAAVGGAGDDLLVAAPGGSRLAGGPGADRLRGGPGRDRLTGGAGADRIDGGAGNDRLVADGSNTVPRTAPVRDVLGCGDGRDRADAPNGSTVWIDCEALLTSMADTWLLRTRPARLLVDRGIAPDFPADYTIVLRRPGSQRVLRTVRSHVTSRDRRRSRFFRVPLTGPAVDVAVTQVSEPGGRERLTARTELRIRLRAP